MRKGGKLTGDRVIQGGDGRTSGSSSRKLIGDKGEEGGRRLRGTPGQRSMSAEVGGEATGMGRGKPRSFTGQQGVCSDEQTEKVSDHHRR